MNTEHTPEIDRVPTTHREDTRSMVGRYLSMLADEPPQDAGHHPSLELHAQVGAEWATWDRQRRAWLTLLAPRLLREAVDDFKGGPTSTYRPTSPAPSTPEEGRDV